ncbi:DUF4199 domain-containing protein [Myroides odoratimimus]|uniref:Uncharacterized protein n=1 Tax=Myroides odoratimimus TaxID=76832 RepID=A0A0S7E935_9FLAO|nr:MULTISPECIES: DUF4199 domain-containing protein [Myroides]ALU28142.1 hypothetical protein AS202_19210 [Myroides odoratimimus]APA93525.1 hypothetical protein BK054_15075 [Myroides sp. ZB35]EHO09095.1 hypothetical protein HMPREF9714_02068 [Myroides odoratimimus CCUG 12901]EKB06436.1 hypothetical protein HMPREF9711_00808 [Myroides odoratimimus CCUG 3837]EPH13118.1 hypothetical protein HMPREF9713_00852 [Myroides odoratimimus CCUG 12700]
MRNFSIEFKWASYATLAALLWMFIVKSLGFHDLEKIRYEVGFELLFNLVLIIFYWLGIRQKKREFYNGVVSWQRAFLSGLVICIMITFFFPIIQYITFNQVSPNFMATLQEALATQTSMSLEEATKNATFDIFLRNGVTNNLSFGVVFIAIISYFIQSKNIAKPVITENKNNKQKKNNKRKNNK